MDQCLCLTDSKDCVCARRVEWSHMTSHPPLIADDGSSDGQMEPGISDTAKVILLKVFTLFGLSSTLVSPLQTF